MARRGRPCHPAAKAIARHANNNARLLRACATLVELVCFFSCQAPRHCWWWHVERDCHQPQCNQADIQAPVPPSSSEVQAFLSLRVTDRDLLYVENDTRRAVCSAHHPKLGNITGSIPFSVLLSAIQATVSKYNPQRLLRRHRQQGHGHRDAGRRRGGTVAVPVNMAPKWDSSGEAGHFKTIRSDYTRRPRPLADCDRDVASPGRLMEPR